ncbi:MAG: hypothetical protein JST85_03620 [Acidobacteria bacterium]|nr:hypothetical protein [Acidobacteriota bacterium]
MNQGELLTRLTIWIAISGYAVGVCLLLLVRESQTWQARARLAWTIGCLGLIAHLICAFHFYHHWNQASALSETARQTAEVTGNNWGGGLYINYAFLAAWIADVAWWWRGLERYRQRHWLITAAWHFVLIFMVFNATVVFKTGVVRWIGIALCSGLLLVWLWSAKSKESPDAEARYKPSSSRRDG